MKKIDLTAMKINRWTVLSSLPPKIQPSGQAKTMWLCKCDCGIVKKVSAYSLKSETSKSCGCLLLEKIKTHGLSNHKISIMLGHIIQRCENKKDKSYKNYGGRGISIYSEWRNNLKCFYDFCIKNGWNENLEIDRIDNDGNYEPNNIRFISHRKNNLNKRRLKSNNKSGYEGVHFSKVANKWCCQIKVKGKVYPIGYFFDKNNAVISRNKYIIKNKLQDDYKIQAVHCANN
jgi:hypothetical protein